MDNLTHSLVGLAAAKAGLERLSPHATLVALIAANAPDSDILALVVGGRWAFLRHHRGITHSIFGTLVLTLLIPGMIFVADRITSRIRSRSSQIKIGPLMIVSLIVGFTHPLLDWTNNYGIRLLLPWSSRWFYGDLVFIVDPVLWLILGGAAFLLTSKTKKQMAAWAIVGAITTALVMFGGDRNYALTKLGWVRGLWITTVIVLVLFRIAGAYARRPKIAIWAFGIVLLYVVGLSVVHSLALRQARLQADLIGNVRNERVLNVAAMPSLANPLRWQCVAVTDQAAYRFDLYAVRHSWAVFGVKRFQNPEAVDSAAVDQALKDPRAQAFLSFARFPILRVSGMDCTTQTLVQFADLRYTEPGARRGAFSLEVPLDCPSFRMDEVPK